MRDVFGRHEELELLIVRIQYIDDFDTAQECFPYRASPAIRLSDRFEVCWQTESLTGHL